MRLTGNQFLDVVLFLALLLPSVILHEVMHGWLALRLGDHTARRAGRLTLNPIRHIDPFGSVILPGLLALARAPVFGWAKPVPVNPATFRNPLPGMALVAIGGPLTNLALAFGAARLVLPQVTGTGARLTLGFVFLNVVLAVFNLLPIPPLDGSRVVRLFLPPKGRALLAQVEPYGILIIFALLFVFDEAFSFLVPLILGVVGWMIG
ncbi:MAG: site-2 protease family protein [Actinomycetota bacterium]|nr:site-2 protease family protein [Actinomycetota bacterium]